MARKQQLMAGGVQSDDLLGDLTRVGQLLLPRARFPRSDQGVAPDGKGNAHRRYEARTTSQIARVGSSLGLRHE